MFLLPDEPVTSLDAYFATEVGGLGLQRAQALGSAATIPDAICAGMRQATGLLPVAAIVTYTSSGSSSLRASRERPAAPILSMAASVATARRLTLAWGAVDGVRVEIREMERGIA